MMVIDDRGVGGVVPRAELEPEPKYSENSEVRVLVPRGGCRAGDLGSVLDVDEGVDPESGQIGYSVWLDSYGQVFSFDEDEIEPTGALRDSEEWDQVVGAVSGKGGAGDVDAE